VRGSLPLFSLRQEVCDIIRHIWSLLGLASAKAWRKWLFYMDVHTTIGQSALDAELVQEEETEAKAEAERSRPGLTIFTDGSPLDDGAAGYAVAWSGESREGIKTHMGYNQEVYDAERAALARALETVARAQPAPERITIFTDARAAIRRMWSEEPSPGQRYAPGKKVCSGAAEGQTGHQHRDPVVPCAQGHSRKREGGPVGETRGRGARHKWSGVAGLLGSSEAREMTLPRSLAHLKREITEKKCEEARKWAGSRTSGQKYRTPKSRRPDGKIAGSTKRLASRACQLKSRHARTRQYLH